VGNTFAGPCLDLLTKLSPMRVLYFSRDYTTHDHRFLLKLSESGHEIWYLRLEKDGIRYEKRPLPEKIHSVEWRGGKKAINTPEAWFRLIPDFQAVLDRIKPDLVHAGPVQSCGFMTAVIGFHPFLVMSWGSDVLVDADNDEMWHWMTLYTLDRSDLLLCDSGAVRDKVQRISDYPEERIIQFPWGIDLCRFDHRDDSLGLKNLKDWEDSFIVLSTRTWEKIYGIDILIKAFQMAYVKNHRLRLILLGEGSLSSKIESFIYFNDLNNVVYRPGMVSYDQISEYYRAVDLYMSCAHSDGTSISLLEALASGLPAIVTDLQGNREWIQHGKNGWLAPAGDAKSNAEILTMVADLNRYERERISQVNRGIAKERANWDKNFEVLLEAYDRIEAKYAR